MKFTKGLFLVALIAGAVAVPASAGPVQWFFGGSGGNTAGFTLSDGTTISGSFSYDASINTPNCGTGVGGCVPGNVLNAAPGVNQNPGGQQPADYNGEYGLFGTGISGGVQTGTVGGVGGITVTAGSSGILTSGTYYLNTNIFDTNNTSVPSANDCCADSTDAWLVSENPATTADLTGAKAIQIFLSSAMTDAGNLYTPGDVISGIGAGTCSDYACGNIYTPAGGLGTVYLTGYDAAANVNTGLQPTNGTPEPSTFFLGLSALAVGAFRKRVFNR